MASDNPALARRWTFQGKEQAGHFGSQAQKPVILNPEITSSTAYLAEGFSTTFDFVLFICECHSGHDR
jgi:hypothetical protein